MPKFHSTDKQTLEHYINIMGFGPAIAMLAQRERQAAKLEKHKARNQREKMASSFPDNRLNAGNLALRSVVGRMGGKRKPKKTKKGY